MSFCGTFGLAACTCVTHLFIRDCLSASLIRALEFADGAVCSCGAGLVRGSAGVGGAVCCARATVTVAIAAKADAARFTVHLLSPWLHTKHLPPADAIGDSLHCASPPVPAHRTRYTTADVATRRHCCHRRLVRSSRGSVTTVRSNAGKRWMCATLLLRSRTASRRRAHAILKPLPIPPAQP
jgi:hypothetical protein